MKGETHRVTNVVDHSSLSLASINSVLVSTRVDAATTLSLVSSSRCLTCSSVCRDVSSEVCIAVAVAAACSRDLRGAVTSTEVNVESAAPPMSTLSRSADCLRRVKRPSFVSLLSASSRFLLDRDEPATPVVESSICRRWLRSLSQRSHACEDVAVEASKGTDGGGGRGVSTGGRRLRGCTMV